MGSVSVTQFLQRLDGDLLPVRNLAERLAQLGASIDHPSGAALISHRPEVGTEAYAFVLYPGVEPKIIDRYEKIGRKAEAHFPTIPPPYRTLLARLNGASLFEMDLFGIPLSITKSPRLLNRASRQPLDVGTANVAWRIPYKADSNQFYFGGAPCSRKENTGYFLNADGSVEGLIRGGKKVGAWASIQEFLTNELARAESLYKG